MHCKLVPIRNYCNGGSKGVETVGTECTQQSADRPRGSLEVCGWWTGSAGQAVCPAYMHASGGMESDVGSYFLIENADKRIHQHHHDVVPSRNKSESEDSAVSGGIKPSRVNKIGFSKNCEPQEHKSLSIPSWMCKKTKKKPLGWWMVVGDEEQFQTFIQFIMNVNPSKRVILLKAIHFNFIVVARRWSGDHHNH